MSPVTTTTAASNATAAVVERFDAPKHDSSANDPVVEPSSVPSVEPLNELMDASNATVATDKLPDTPEDDLSAVKQPMAASNANGVFDPSAAEGDTQSNDEFIFDMVGFDGLELELVDMIVGSDEKNPHANASWNQVTPGSEGFCKLHIQEEYECTHVNVRKDSAVSSVATHVTPLIRLPDPTQLPPQSGGTPVGTPVNATQVQCTPASTPTNPSSLASVVHRDNRPKTLTDLLSKYNQLKALNAHTPPYQPLRFIIPGGYVCLSFINKNGGNNDGDEFVHGTGSAGAQWYAYIIGPEQEGEDPRTIRIPLEHVESIHVKPFYVEPNSVKKENTWNGDMAVLTKNKSEQLLDLLPKVRERMVKRYAAGGNADNRKDVYSDDLLNMVNRDSTTRKRGEVIPHLFRFDLLVDYTKDETPMRAQCPGCPWIYLEGTKSLVTKYLRDIKQASTTQTTIMS